MQSTDSSEVRQSQLWRQTGDITFFPVLNKVLNEFTNQASCVMISSNHLYDRFLHAVMCKLFPGDDSKATFRRFCGLSILTLGNASCSTDSFFNSPHVDTTDRWRKEVQEAAKSLLSEWRTTHSGNKDVLDGIRYLEDMAGLSGGYFSVPTTCGYNIICNSEVDLQKEHQINAHFVMLGLGVSVRIRSGCYHYFHASHFNHCTAIPVTVRRAKMAKAYAGLFNIIGWGGASPSK